MSNLMNQINEVINDLQNNDADYKVILNTFIACKEALAQPAQKPQYLYVFRTCTNGQIEYKLWPKKDTGGAYIAKIKLESDDD